MTSEKLREETENRNFTSLFDDSLEQCETRILPATYTRSRQHSSVVSSISRWVRPFRSVFTHTLTGDVSTRCRSGAPRFGHSNPSTWGTQSPLVDESILYQRISRAYCAPYGPARRGGKQTYRYYSIDRFQCKWANPCRLCVQVGSSFSHANRGRLSRSSFLARYKSSF